MPDLNDFPVKNGSLNANSGDETCVNLQILHFNDVYNVGSRLREPVGGAARFKTALRQLTAGREGETLVLFSGDCLSPSTLSNITKGEHMIQVLNQFNIAGAVIGNHEFDFGADNFLDCLELSNFPWLNTNLFDADTNAPFIEGTREYVVVERFGGMLRIGLIGLIEPDWVDTLSAVDADQLRVLDPVNVAADWARKLREEHHCHLVIALTHMRWPNDLRLAAEAAGIDLVLGGHDHEYDIRSHVIADGSASVYVIKSGSDFRDMNCLSLRVRLKKFESQELSTKVSASNLVELSALRVQITTDFSEDEEVSRIVATYTTDLDARMNESLGNVDVDLELRFERIRTEETNAGDFVCDLVFTALDADVVLINSGSLRTDALVPAGDYKMRDLHTMLPFLSPMLLLETPGWVLLQALENSVSQYPKLEGRFLQVAGIRFEFNPLLPSGHRINHSSVRLTTVGGREGQAQSGESLNANRLYKVAVTAYVAEGNEGYDVLCQNSRRLIDYESSPQLITIIQNYFHQIQVLQGQRKLRIKHHPQLVVSRRAWRHLSLQVRTSVCSGEDLMLEDEDLQSFRSLQWPTTPTSLSSDLAEAHTSLNYSPSECGTLSGQGTLANFDSFTSIEGSGYGSLRSVSDLFVLPRERLQTFRVAPVVDGRIQKILS